MIPSRRIIVLVLVFVVIGAALNVGLATFLSLRASWLRVIDDRTAYAAAVWPVPVPEHWPPPETHLRGREWGLHHWQWSGRTDRLPVMHTTHRYEVARMGWPMRAMQWEACFETRIEPRAGGHNVEFENFGPSWRRTGLIVGERWGRVPMQPVWPGFLINTVLFGVAAWCLWCSPRVVRRRLRRRRGACIWCGYLRAGLRGDALCPECGGVIG